MDHQSSWIRRRGLLGTTALTLIGATLLGAPPIAQAQDAAPAAVGLEEIVVTAQRRGENLQDVPVTVTAITAEAAKAQGVNSTADLATATPGLIMTPLLGVPQIYIRGVGTQNTSAGDEPSNAVYVDGVYMPDMPTGLFSLNNIERIEVLKGPQGTLFGRNSTGGLIQVVTRDPSFTRTADLSASYANYNTGQFEIYGSTPLSANVAADLALHYRSQGDGWGRNIFNGADIYRDRDFAVRSKVLWNIGDNTTARFTADYLTAHGTSIVARQPLAGTLGVGGTPNTGDFYNVNLNLQPFSDSKSWGATARVEHDFSWAKLVSISAYRRMRFEFLADQDSSPVNLNNGNPVQRTHYFTQELQLQSPAQARVSWIAGLFFYNHNLDLFLNRSGTSFAAVGGFSQVFSKQETTSYAAYAQATVPVTARLKLTAGARYTEDHREFDSQQFQPTRGLNTFITSEKTWPKVTWRAAADYQVTDDALVYASYSRGFKSGIYPTFSPSATPIEPEVLDAIEVGAKTEWLDRRLRLNLSLYDYDYSNIQLTVTRAGSSLLLNAGGAKIQGFDGELLAKPVEGLTLRAAINLIDGEYTNFPSAPASLLNPVVVVPPGYTCPATRPTTAGGTLACSIDATGNTTIRSPEVTYNLGLNYRWAMPFGEMAADVSYYHNSGYFFEVDNRVKQPAYGTVNAQLSARMQDGRYVVRLWAKNLTDEQYFAVVSTSLSDTFAPSAPRTVGVTLEAHY